MISFDNQAEEYMGNLRRQDVLFSDCWGEISVYDRNSVPYCDAKSVLIWVPGKPALVRADNFIVTLRDGNFQQEFGAVNLLICHGGSNKGKWCPEYHEKSFLEILSGIEERKRKRIEAIVACNPSRQVLPTAFGFHRLTYFLGKVSCSVKFENGKLNVRAEGGELISKGEPS